MNTFIPDVSQHTMDLANWLKDQTEPQSYAALSEVAKGNVQGERRGSLRSAVRIERRAGRYWKTIPKVGIALLDSEGIGEEVNAGRERVKRLATRKRKIASLIEPNSLSDTSKARVYGNLAVLSAIERIGAKPMLDKTIKEVMQHPETVPDARALLALMERRAKKGAQQ